ncbi:MAG: hypothetical protein E7306_07005 [Butyrivibrio sp.]|jgi:hypothetical protein|nr:hypothetical protein [Butyrivibrio sp.]
MSSEQKADSPKSVKAVIVAGIAVIIILLIVVIVLLLTRGGKEGKEEPKEEARRNVLVTEENVEEVADDFFNEEYTPPGYFSATMSNVWHFSTGDAVSEDAYVADDSSNSNDIYFDIFLAEDEDENNPIYQSPVIPLGGELKNIKLDKELKAGTYDCIMIYHLVDEEQKTLDTIRVGLTIIVGP